MLIDHTLLLIHRTSPYQVAVAGKSGHILTPREYRAATETASEGHKHSLHHLTPSQRSSHLQYTSSEDLSLAAKWRQAWNLSPVSLLI